MMTEAHIHTVDDLKNRTQVESNILKSLILSKDNRLVMRSLRDLLIQDYQIANSITINSILANFIVNFGMTLSSLGGSDGSLINDSYFRIVNSVSEVKSLSEQTKLVLQMDDSISNGSFYANKVMYDVAEIECNPGTMRFVNLDTVWYSVVVSQVITNKESQINDNNKHAVVGGLDVQYESGYESYDSSLYDKTDEEITDIDPADLDPAKWGSVNNSWESVLTYEQMSMCGMDMNDELTCRYPYGHDNIFDNEVCVYENDYTKPTKYSSFNHFIRDFAIENQSNVKINCILKNRFYKSNEFDTKLLSKDDIKTQIDVLNRSQYMVCLTTGFYGIVIEKNDDAFSVNMYNIGKHIQMFVDSNPDDTFEFLNCQFISADEITTMMLTFKSRKNGSNARCIYINGSSYDGLYDFVEIDKVVCDQIVTDQAFNNIDSIKELDSISIALTDFGFWDIEKNNTDELTYAYSGRKSSEKIDTPKKDKDKDKPKMIVKDKSKMISYWVGLNGSELVNCYDTVFTCNNTQYNGYSINDASYEKSPNGISYLKTIQNHNIAAATKDFAVYDATTSEPLFILVKISENQFYQLLSTNQPLMSLFLNWIYGQVINDEEYWLKTHDSEFIKKLTSSLDGMTQFNQQSYSLTSDDHLSNSFRGIKELIATTNTSSNNLVSYCVGLKNVLSRDLYSVDVFSDNDVLSANISQSFEESNYLQNVVDESVKELEDEYGFLTYFNEYLKRHLRHILESSTYSINYEDHISEFKSKLSSYIQTLVPATMVLGGYDSDKTGNACYPGLNAYLYHDDTKISKSKIQDIMSSRNILKVVTDAVQDTDFFKSYDSYSALNESRNSTDNSELFKFRKDINFLKKSDLVTTDGQINVNWGEMKEWLFSSEMTQETILKAFVKTQIYRNIFFDPTNYTNFTKDESKYTCEVDKFYINHDGLKKELKFTNVGDTVDSTASGLKLSGEHRTIADIQYSRITNGLSYDIIYDSIDINDNKFIYQDIEFYVMINDDGNPISVYFNQFQRESNANSQPIPINDSKFTLGGIIYEIVYSDGKKLKLNWKTEPADEDEVLPNKFSQEIIDNRFKINGIWYFISDGEINFASVEDKELTKLFVSSGFVAKYDDWGLEFHFTPDTKQVKIKQHYQTRVIDKVKAEWCAFDNVQDVNITPKCTFDYYIANELLKLKNANIEWAVPVQSLGDGVLYNGGLNLSNCHITLKHDVYNNRVMSSCVLTKPMADGKTEEQDLGTLIDYNGRLSSGKVVTGTLINGVVSPGTPDYTFILKNPSLGHNNINSVWLKTDDFNSSLFLNKEVGVYSQNEDTKEINVEFNVLDVPTTEFTLIPVVEQGDQTSYNSQYTIAISGHEENNMTVDVVDNKLHFIVPTYASNGSVTKYDRFYIDLNSSDTVYQISFEQYCSTVDFSTQYTYATLLDKLFTNVKQSMMNTIIQTMVDNGSNNQITISDTGYDTFVDMFQDNESINNYILTQNIEEDSDSDLKYREIFKNHIVSIIEDNIYKGKLYDALSSVIDRQFSGQSSPQLVDCYLISANRFDNSYDTFQYELYVDVHLNEKKGVLTNQDKGRYIPSGFVFHDVRVIVKFTPTLSVGDSSLDIKYDVEITVPGQQVQFTFDKIVYNYNGRVMTKFASGIVNSAVTVVGETIKQESGKPLEQMTTAVLANEITKEVDNGFGELFKNAFINNVIPNLQNGFEVDREEVKNPECQDSIWELNAPIPDDLNPYVISRGKTFIDNEIYNVVLGTEGEYLLRHDGLDSFDIRQIPAIDDEDPNETKNYNVAVSRVPRFTSNEVLEKFDFAVDGDKARCAIWKTNPFDINDELSGILINERIYDIFSTGIDNVYNTDLGNQFSVTISGEFTQGEFRVSFTSDSDNDDEFIQAGLIHVQVVKTTDSQGDDSFKVTVKDGTPCRKFSMGLPDDNQIKSFVEYNVVHGSEVEVTNVEKSNSDGSESDESDKYDLIFTLPGTQQVKYIKRHDSGASEYVSNGFYCQSNNIRYVSYLTDVKGNIASSSFNYGMINFPISPYGVSYYDIKYQSLLITFNDVNVESAYYAPVYLEVKQPNEKYTSPGDVYDRYYATENILTCDPIDKDNDKIPENMWLDNVTTIKSSNIKSTGYYSKLRGNTVPQMMRDEVQSYVDGLLRRSPEYFTMITQRLQNFLEKVQHELRMTLDEAKLKSVSPLKYDVIVTYPSINGLIQRPNDDCGDVFEQNLTKLKEHLRNEFSSDNISMDGVSDEEMAKRDYFNFLKQGYDSVSPILDLKKTTISDIFGLLNTSPSSNDRIYDIFGDSSDFVRYINRVNTQITDQVLSVYQLSSNDCHIFTKTGGETSKVIWWNFKFDVDKMVEFIKVNQRNVQYRIGQKFSLYPIVSDKPQLVMASRDIHGHSNLNVYSIRCEDGFWYFPLVDSYLYNDKDTISDVAYEINSGSLLVVFEGDSHIYKYNGLKQRRTFDGKIYVSKGNYDMRLTTFLNQAITDKTKNLNTICVDYGEEDINLKIWGTIVDDSLMFENWSIGNGLYDSEFKLYNQLLFGDSLFNDKQLSFQNISKNKDMVDIIDVDEVDGCYYGLFKDNNDDDDNRWVAFKIPTDGVIRRLPYKVILPKLYRTADDLYSLYVLIEDTDGKVKLREISVPDSDLYKYREIPVQDEVLKQVNGQGSSFTDIQVTDVMLDTFKPGHIGTSFFVLSNYGYHKIGYKNDLEQLSVDTVEEFAQKLYSTVGEVLMSEHNEKFHKNVKYFDYVSRKINQFDDDFTVFSLIPTEFGQTQDVGVVPSSKIDDTDEKTDHRGDSVTVSTDILVTDGMTLGYDQNPGFITGAVSNPATIYDDDNVFTKSQRNPSLEGTEFYDYIYDQDGNALMDLYSVPFIYRINSNNTYDLYINVPTTRTKYLNRVAGTLKDDLTTQVLKDDVRSRRNFLGEALANNLDESTTKLRIYIDRKYISIGNVELVEISGNSIPQQIYRDSSNNGLYDSIALESRWNGEVVELNEPDKDINKVMLEFECYGTDSQSIHIVGKTLVNAYLDDAKYKFG